MEYNSEELKRLYQERQMLIKEKERKIEERKKVTERLRKERIEKVAKQKDILKRGSKIIATTVLLGTLLFRIEKHFNPTNIFSDDVLKISSSKKEELYQSISKETSCVVIENERLLVLNAVIENKKLTQEEKEVIYQFKDIILENPYLNKKEAYKALRKVNIVQKEGKEAEVLAKYNYQKKLVSMYLKESDSRYEETLEHEIVHCLYYTEKSKMLPGYLREGMAELLVNEYFSNEPYVEYESYPYEITAVKQLCNMVGKDKVLEAYSSGNINVVRVELSKTMPEEDSKRFLENLETLFYNYAENNRVTDEKRYNEVIKYLLKFDKERITSALEKNTMTEQFKKNLEESAYNIDLLKLLIKENTYQVYLNYIAENGVYVQPYFSNELKEAIETPYVYFPDIPNLTSKVDSNILVKMG